MTHYKVVWTLPRKSNVLNDAVDWDFHYRTLSGVTATSTELDHLRDDFASFFNTPSSGGTHEIQYYISNAIKRTASSHTVTYYELPGSRGPMGRPVATRQLTPSGGGGGSTLPAEDALCLSYHGAYDSIPEHGAGGTRPKARWRGRVYLGPLQNTTLTTDGTTGEVTVASMCTIDVCDSASQYLLTAAQGHGWQWEVFSPTDWVWHDVVGGWCDAEFDTQRRRGRVGTLRSTFP